MAARHFAQNVPQIDEEEQDSLPQQETESGRGKHFRTAVVEEAPDTIEQPAAIPSVPEPQPASEPQPVPMTVPEPASVPTLEPQLVPVLQSAPVPVVHAEAPTDSNSDARAYIDQILLELEASFAKPAPEPEPEPEPVVVPEPEVTPVPELVSAPGSMQIPMIESDDNTGAAVSYERATFWGSAQEPVQESVQDAGALKVEKTADLSAARDSDDNELESTAVLDHEAIRQAVEEQEEDDIHEEHVAPRRHERIEVDSGFYVPPNNTRSDTSNELATRKPRLSFFAKIGEFIARLFHIDD